MSGSGSNVAQAAVFTGVAGFSSSGKELVIQTAGRTRSKYHGRLNQPSVSLSAQPEPCRPFSLIWLTKLYFSEHEQAIVVGESSASVPLRGLGIGARQPFSANGSVLL